MKWLPMALSVGLLLIAVPAMAENPSGTDIRFGSTISAGEVTSTPEMWFYEQYVNRYQDPKAAVRVKAEERSAQRRARLAAQRWFGFSNLRPQAGPDVIYGNYSPAWTGTNSNYPFRWYGYGTAAVVVHTNRVNGIY